jgi:signal transduction histidine kinase
MGAAHGGEIKAETKEGEGSEFIIQLPIKEFYGLV